MSHDFQAMLRTYAAESGELHETTVINTDIADDSTIIGADEITVITDATQNNLEEHLDDLASKVDGMSDSLAAADRMAEAVDGLEALESRLVTMAQAGIKIDATAMEFFTSSVVATLEARQIPAELYMPSIQAAMHSFESGNLDDYTAEAEEIVSGDKKEGSGKPGILARLYNVLKTIGAGIVRIFNELIASMGKSASAIKTSGEKLKRVGGGIKGKPKAATVATKLADPVGVLSKAISAYSEVSTLQGKIGTAVDSLTKALNGGTAGGDATVAATSIDLGISTLKYTPGEGGKLAGSKITTEGAKGEGGTIKVMQPASIVELGKKLVSVADTMMKLQGDAKTAAAKTDSILKAAGKAASKDTTMTPEQRTAAQASIKTAQQALKATKGLIPVYVGQLGAAAKAAYKAGIASASKYTGKESDNNVPDGNADTGAKK